MIEGEAFTTSFDDSCSSGLGETKGSNLHLWNFKKSVIVSHFANNNGDFVPMIYKSISSAGTYCPFKSWETLEIEIGGLLTLEETSLLKTVLLNELSVLLERNLNNCIQNNRVKNGCYKVLTLIKRC